MNKVKISLFISTTFLVLAVLIFESQNTHEKIASATPYLEKIKKTPSHEDENTLNPFSTNYAKRAVSQEQLLNNNLPYKQLKQLFDQFVMESNINQKPIDFRQLEKKVILIVTPQKTGPAMNLFKKYIQYLDEIKEMDRLAPTAAKSGESFWEGIQKGHEKLYYLRSKIFNPEEHTQLFGDEEIFDKTSLAIAKISEDNKLSDQQKQEEIKSLKSTLPLNMRNTNSEFLMAMDIKVNQIITNGGSNDDVYRYRANIMNPEAAARFAELDRDEENWKQKIANYTQSKQNILQSSRNEAEVNSAINILRSIFFNESERKRLPAYENLN